MNSQESLNLRMHGEGEPAFLFVHGFGCTLEDWAPQVEALSASFRCVALDLPGHGASAPTVPTMSALAAAVNIAKERSGARRVILVGHSLGCKVVREAYAQSRDAVAGIVLIEGALYLGDRQTLIDRATQAIDRAGFHAYAEQHFAAMFVDGSDPALRRRIVARVRDLDPTFGRDLYLEAVGWDPLRGRPTLSNLQLPVLLIQSTHIDSNFKRHPLQPGLRTPFMEAVAQLCPQARLEVIQGCGHFPMSEAPREINRLLKEFARGLPG
jgi:pimeloyl-ACP methyl ester carboxylesterase